MPLCQEGKKEEGHKYQPAANRAVETSTQRKK